MAWRQKSAFCYVLLNLSSEMGNRSGLAGFFNGGWRCRFLRGPRLRKATFAAKFPGKFRNPEAENRVFLRRNVAGAAGTVRYRCLIAEKEVY